MSRKTGFSLNATQVVINLINIVKKINIVINLFSDGLALILVPCSNKQAYNHNKLHFFLHYDDCMFTIVLKLFWIHFVFIVKI